MIISKSNITSGSTTALIAGVISSGSLPNVLNPDFSKTLSTTSATFEFEIESVGPCHYVALHGLSLPIGTVVNVTGTSFVKTFTVNRSIKNLMFHSNVAVTLGDLSIELVGSGTKVISYIQAGKATTIDWGTNSGQKLHYFGYNNKSRVTTNSRGVPTRHLNEEVSPTLRLSIKSALKSWVRGDLREVFEQYDQTGILSLIDYEDEGKPEESYALFDLKNGTPATHSQTTTLLDISLSFRVSA